MSNIKQELKRWKVKLLQSVVEKSFNFTHVLLNHSYNCCKKHQQDDNAKKVITFSSPTKPFKLALDFTTPSTGFMNGTSVAISWKLRFYNSNYSHVFFWFRKANLLWSQDQRKILQDPNKFSKEPELTFLQMVSPGEIPIWIVQWFLLRLFYLISDQKCRNTNSTFRNRKPNS